MTTTVVFQLPLRFGDADHHSQLLNRQLHVVPEQPVGRGNSLWITAIHAAHPVGLHLIQFRQHPSRLRSAAPAGNALCNAFCSREIALFLPKTC